MDTMIEYVSNYYSPREVWQHLASRFRRKPETEPEFLQPVQQVWLPKSELERTVYAALVLAGEPGNNLKLAALMGVSPGESSRRVAQLEHVINKRRQGREVLISLN
jgi:hypothetical protein